MTKIEIFKNDQMTVYYYHENKIIYHVCHKQLLGQPFRDALLAAAEAFIKYKAVKWLSDDRKNPMLTTDDQKWSSEVWQPKIFQAGWKYWGLVMPTEALGQMRMNLLAQTYTKLGVTVKTFDDPSKAFTWLKTIA